MYASTAYLLLAEAAGFPGINTYDELADVVESVTGLDDDLLKEATFKNPQTAANVRKVLSKRAENGSYTSAKQPTRIKSHNKYERDSNGKIKVEAPWPLNTMGWDANQWFNSNR